MADSRFTSTALGAIRLAYNIWYAVSLDRQGILPDGNDTLKMP